MKLFDLLGPNTGQETYRPGEYFVEYEEVETGDEREEKFSKYFYYGGGDKCIYSTRKHNVEIHTLQEPRKIDTEDGVITVNNQSNWITLKKIDGREYNIRVLV